MGIEFIRVQNYQIYYKMTHTASVFTERGTSLSCKEKPRSPFFNYSSWFFCFATYPFMQQDNCIDKQDTKIACRSGLFTGLKCFRLWRKIFLHTFTGDR